MTIKFCMYVKIVVRRHLPAENLYELNWPIQEGGARGPPTSLADGGHGGEKGHGWGWGLTVQ